MNDAMKHDTDRWPEEARLDMIEKSEWYENPKNYQYGYYDGYQRARAEIERLKGVVISQITPEPLVLSRYSTTAEPAKDERDKLIEQMREALAAAKNDGKMQSAITYQLIRAALSAAERGK